MGFSWVFMHVISEKGEGKIKDLNLDCVIHKCMCYKCKIIIKFQYLLYIVAVSIIGGGNRSTWRKTTDMSQDTDKLYHVRLFLKTFNSENRGINITYILTWIRYLLQTKVTTNTPVTTICNDIKITS